MSKTIKILISREKGEEIYKFADRYVYPRESMKIDDYVKRIRIMFPKSLMDILRDPHLCEAVFFLDDLGECDVDPEKISEEFWSSLEENEEFNNLIRDLNADLWNTRIDEYEIVIDDKITIEPWIDLRDEEYRIYLIVSAKQ